MIKCPLCGKISAQPHLIAVQSVYSDKPYDVYYCENCSHFFTHPLPSSKALGYIYSNKYSYAAHSLINPEKKMRAANYAKHIAKLGVKTAFEIGCMHGLLLIELEKNSIKAAGIEPDEKAAKYCRAKGLDVAHSSLEDYSKRQSTKKYDVIIMSHVLEHIVEPKKQVELLKNHLTKTGRLIIIVPNSMAYTRKWFGRFWGYWQVPIHINHFNSGSMTRLLETGGFKIENIKYVGADSLFFLSSLANRFGSKNDTHDLSLAKKIFVKIASITLRPWYYFGNEDMIIVAKKMT